MSETLKQPQSPTLDAAPVVNVPYSSLTASPYNVRRKEPTQIDAMADSIRQAGLLQNLVVHETKKGRSKKTAYGVCAGLRRHRALDVLHARGELPADFPVPVKIVSEAEARAISLVENSAREPMHPADQCEAFRGLVEEGRTIEHIAALFSVSAVTVQRRLKLANASPELFSLFRADGITLDQLMALCLTDDHAQQESVWFNAQDWMRDPARLRDAITKNEIDASRSALAQFVGLDAYEAAGGQVRRDLFSETGTGYLVDPALLNRLAMEKLDIIAAPLRTDWSWVETRPSVDYTELQTYSRLQKTLRALSAEEQAERDALEQRRDQTADELEMEQERGDEETDFDALGHAYEQAESALDDFDSRRMEWTDEQKQVSGVYVAINPSGDVVIHYGLVKREDKQAAARALGDATPASLHRDASGAGDEKPIHGEKLYARLSAHRTAIVRLELSRRPEVALVALLARMIPDVFDWGTFERGTDSPLVIASETVSRKLMNAADDMGDSPAWQAFENDHQRWLNELLPHRKNLTAWLFEQDGETLKNLFSFCVAATLDSVTTTDKPHGVNVLADALGVDYRAYWQVTGASYLNHVPKARVLAVVKEAISPEAAAPLEKQKKAEAVATAERLLQGSGWLPEVLRNRAQPSGDAALMTLDDGEEEEADDEQ